MRGGRRAQPLPPSYSADGRQRFEPKTITESAGRRIGRDVRAHEDLLERCASVQPPFTEEMPLFLGDSAPGGSGSLGLGGPLSPDGTRFARPETKAGSPAARGRILACDGQIGLDPGGFAPVDPLSPSLAGAPRSPLRSGGRARGAPSPFCGRRQRVQSSRSEPHNGLEDVREKRPQVGRPQLPD
jgi:hypothetical protein